MIKSNARRLRKILVFALIDAVCVIASMALAHLLTAGVAEQPENHSLWHIVNFLLVALSFSVGGLYNMAFHTAGLSEALRVFAVLGVNVLFNLIFVPLSGSVHYLPVVLYFFFLSAFVLLSRFSSRLMRTAHFHLAARKNYTRVMVVGGGDAGSAMIREMKNSDKVRYYPACVIDDDPEKLHTRIEGVPVVGNRQAIKSAAIRYSIERIFITIPSAKGKDMSEITELCTATGCRVQVLPGVAQLLKGASTKQLRNVEINDLLGRDPMVINSDEVHAFIRGKRVLVTGGGGSIGSELCRQIAAREPEMLVIFDIYENNAYDIEMELRQTYPQLNLQVLIGSVRDEKRVRDVFEATRPQVVFHAAAHKHVPLMETSPNEAVKNNVFGTFNVARIAGETGVDRFVLISTDKAVNPTNVMGATKRICEMIVQYFSRHSTHTEYAAVRFGNVLGSNGSVIPLFKKQIAAGGPVKVTHKDIIRYFMTIPEAVALVLQAGTFAKGGEIFVLDMGEPVKILSLAENLIRLSGYKPYVDIPIIFTGLRPGEKLYEELLMAEEGMKSTANDRIRIGSPIEFDEAELLASLNELREQMVDDANDLRPLIRRLVPTFHDSLGND